MGVTHSQVKSIVQTEISHASKKVATPPPQEWTYKQSTDSLHGMCSEGDKGAILYCGVETKGNRVRQSDLVQLRPNCGKDKGYMVNRNDFNQAASLCKSDMRLAEIEAKRICSGSKEMNQCVNANAACEWKEGQCKFKFEEQYHSFKSAPNSKRSHLYCSGVERVINLDAPGTVQENSNVGRTPNMEYVHPLVLNCLEEDFLKN